MDFARRRFFDELGADLAARSVADATRMDWTPVVGWFLVRCPWVCVEQMVTASAGTAAHTDVHHADLGCPIFRPVEPALEWLAGGGRDLHACHTPKFHAPTPGTVENNLTTTRYTRRRDRLRLPAWRVGQTSQASQWVSQIREYRGDPGHASTLPVRPRRHRPESQALQRPNQSAR